MPLWNRNKGNVETAEARQAQGETVLYVARRDLERRIVQTAMAYQTKLAEMEKWRPESVDEFRKAAELADRHYRLGAVPIATYVELQKQYLEAACHWPRPAACSRYGCAGCRSASRQPWASSR